MLRCIKPSASVKHSPRKASEKAAHMALGTKGEEEAARFMATRGFSLLAQNWRPQGAEKRLELDLVGTMGDTVVFVEVKARKTVSLRESPPVVANFSSAKKRNILRAAKAFLSAYSLWDRPVRFDLVCVTFSPQTGPHVELYTNVIELGQTLDSGNTAWQPW